MPITIDTIWFNRILIAAAFFVLGCVSKGRLYHLRAPWYNNRELLEQVPWNVKDAIDFPDSLITARICPSPTDADLRIIQKTTEYSTRLGYNVGPWGYWFYVRASLLLRPHPPPPFVVVLIGDRNEESQTKPSLNKFPSQVVASYSETQKQTWSNWSHIALLIQHWH